jgi:hypothetical protein
MIYRCDLQHFLVHAIDYFTLPELSSIQYAIISSKISSGGRSGNVAKINALYPAVESIIAYDDYKDKKIFEQMYISMLDGKDEPEESNPFANTIYRVFINPLLEHYDVMIICDAIENVYIDVLCKYLKEKFEIEVIDLNELFTKGCIESIYINRDEIRDKAVDIRRAAIKEQIRNMSSTRDGKEQLISKMSKKEKIKQLKKYGVKLGSNDKDLDQILLEEWCAEDGDNLDDY